MSKIRRPGHVRQRGNKYTVIISTTDPATGKRRRDYHSGYTDPDEANNALNQLLVKVEAGTYVSPDRNLTLKAFLTDKWLPEVEDNVRPSTYESYRLHVENYIVPRIGNVKLQDLRPDHLNRLYRDLRKEGGRGGRPLSDRTVQLTHVTIRKALKDAGRWGYVTRNVAEVASRPKVKRRKKMRVWTADELRRFLAHAEEADPRLYPLWHLAATTGMRRGALLGARWRDLDPANRRLSVRQTVTAVRNEIMFGEPKTEKGKRNVALDVRTMQVLHGHRTAQAAEKLSAGPAWQDLDLIFTEENGTPLHPDAISKRFKILVISSGVTPISLHEIRHTYATLALQAGVHVKIVSERLGHSSVMVTLDTYSHAIPSMQEAAAEQVAALVFGE